MGGRGPQADPRAVDMKFGPWWAVQRNAGFSLGLHLELRTRTARAGVRFGPYVDVHFVSWVLSIGRNPIYAGEVDLLRSFARGGLS